MMNMRVPYANYYHAYPRPKSSGLAFDVERDLRKAVERDMKRALVVIEEAIDEEDAARYFFPVFNFSSYLVNQVRGMCWFTDPEGAEEDEAFDWLFASRGWYQVAPSGWKFHV